MRASDWSFREWTRKSIEEVIHQYYLNKYGDKVYPAMFGVDLISLLLDNLTLIDNRMDARFGDWKVTTDGPSYSEFIYDTESPNGKPVFFIPIFELKSANKIFTPSQWEGDYTDYKCIVKDVTYGMHNNGDETVTPFTLQCLVVYAKGANPNPNPLIFDNPLPKMGKKWKYKNENAYIRNNTGDLKVSHCTIETELEFKFDDVNNYTLISSEYTKITIPSMLSASVTDPHNHIVGAMRLNPLYSSNTYPNLDGKHFNGIPSFGIPNTFIDDYTFNCNIPNTTLDSADGDQSDLFISYVEADDFRLHFIPEPHYGAWGYSLGLPLYDTHYSNVIAEMRYHA